MPVLSVILRASVLSLAAVTPSLSQDWVPVPVDPVPPVSRAVLQSHAIGNSGMDATLALIDIAPNVTAGRHAHPGDVSAYVVYGSIELEIDGKATRFVAGESFTVPANTVHTERTGAVGARIVASFVVPTGVALSTPVN